jgi:aryl-alcohol dehydrogenase-like predicted oxidoreductase
MSYRHVVGDAERALRRLGTDWIDLYQLHGPDFVNPWEETLRALDDLVSRGLVRYVGWSNHPAWHAARAEGIQRIHGYAPFISAQIYYSVIGRQAEHEILPCTRAAGLGTLIWSPLAGGFLTGKYTRDDPSGQGGRRSAFSVPPINHDRGYQAVGTMREIADRYQSPVAHVAYAWLLAKPEVSTIIVPQSGDGDYRDADGVVGAACPRIPGGEGGPVLFGGQRHQRIVNGTACDAKAAERVRQLTGKRSAQHERRSEARIQQPGGVGWC